MHAKVRRLRMKAWVEYHHWTHAPFCTECRPDAFPYILVWVALMATMLMMGSER